MTRLLIYHIIPYKKKHNQRLQHKRIVTKVRIIGHSSDNNNFIHTTMNHGANDRVIEPARGVDETIARFAATTIRDELHQNNETNIIKMKEFWKIYAMMLILTI